MVVDRHRDPFQGMESAVIEVEFAHVGLEHGAFDAGLRSGGNLHGIYHLMFLRRR